MKNITKALSLVLVLAMLLTLAACGGKPETPNTPASTPNTPASTPASTDAPETPTEAARVWTGFHGWLDEDWDAKEVAYQFTGYWDMGDPEYGIAFSFLMNLYADGSVQICQYQADRADYRYFGGWELVEDPDGDELHIKVAEETNESGELIDHKYSYEIYEESDGGFSFGYDFGIAAGQYFRVANMAGSKEVNYANVDAFKAAADEGAFVVAAPVEEGTEEGGETEEVAGYSCPINLGGNEMTAVLTLDDETNATLVAAVTFTCTYTKTGSVVVLDVAGELEGYQAQIWPAIEHIYVVNDEDMTMKGATAAYDASGLTLVTFADGTMRVEFPQYSMARDGFTYELSEDGATLTVTGTPDAEAMGGFQQVWDGMGGETWTIDGNTAALAG